MANGPHKAHSITRETIESAYIIGHEPAQMFIEIYGRSNKRFLRDLNKPTGKVPLTPPSKP